MNWIKKLFCNKIVPKDMVPIPKRPSDWNLTLDDLFAEMEAGKRKSIGSPEGDWAREYELTLIPEGVRFPKKGDLYELNEDKIISYMSAWSSPFTGDGESMMFKGERIWIEDPPRDEKSLGTYALPLEYDKLEKRMVSPEERKNPKFTGFYFYFNTVDLNKNFTLIDTEFNPKSGISGDSN